MKEEQLTPLLCSPSVEYPIHHYPPKMPMRLEEGLTELNEPKLAKPRSKNLQVENYRRECVKESLNEACMCEEMKAARRVRWLRVDQRLLTIPVHDPPPSIPNVA